MNLGRVAQRAPSPSDFGVPRELLRVACVSLAMLVVLCIPVPLLEEDGSNTAAIGFVLLIGPFLLAGAGCFWFGAFEEVVVTADGVTRHNPFWSESWGWTEIDDASLGQWTGIVPQLDLTNGSQRSFYPLGLAGAIGAVGAAVVATPTTTRLDQTGTR